MSALEDVRLREHLHMLLEAMQYKGSTFGMSLDTLRDLVEHEKLNFLRRLQAEHDKLFLSATAYKATYKKCAN